MSWVAIAEADVISEGFNPSETAAINGVQEATIGLAAILLSTINEARGWIAARGDDLGADGTAPNVLKPHIIALARWRWLITCPKLALLQTEARQKAAEKAQEILLDVAKGDLPIDPALEDEDEEESPLAGSWNSELKIPMRTFSTDAN